MEQRTGRSQRDDGTLHRVGELGLEDGERRDCHACGIRTTGRLYCWGNDDFGQVGDGGANIDRSIPVEVAGGATDWTAVDAGDFHTCARHATGRLYCWGGDAAGQLGTGAGSGDQTTPVEVSGGGTNWTAVSAGPNHTCAAAPPDASTAGAWTRRGNSVTVSPTSTGRPRSRSPVV